MVHGVCKSWHTCCISHTLELTVQPSGLGPALEIYKNVTRIAIINLELDLKKAASQLLTAFEEADCSSVQQLELVRCGFTRPAIALKSRLKSHMHESPFRDLEDVRLYCSDPTGSNNTVRMSIDGIGALAALPKLRILYLQAPHSSDGGRQVWDSARYLDLLIVSSAHDVTLEALAGDMHGGAQGPAPAQLPSGEVASAGFFGGARSEDHGTGFTTLAAFLRQNRLWLVAVDVIERALLAQTPCHSTAHPCPQTITHQQS